MYRAIAWCILLKYIWWGFLFVRTETGQEDDYARYYDNVAPIEEFVNVQQQV